MISKKYIKDLEFKKKLKDIIDLQVKEGILYKELYLSIERREDKKTLKEWKEHLRELPFIKKNLIELKGGIKE